MSDDRFTPALWLFGLLLGFCLAYLELALLRRSLQFPGWAALAPITLVNVVFGYIFAACMDSYGGLFIFPVPVIPVAYLGLKALAYFAVNRMGGGPLQAPVLTLFGSLLFHFT